MTDSAIALGALADQLLARAAAASSGRATQAIPAAAKGGVLTTVVLALMAGQQLSEHENPGEGFLHVLRGRMRLSSGADEWELGEGDLAPIPQRRHGVVALADSVALLTVAKTTT